jgi:cell pole-organizing protein PopZ
MTKPKSDNMSMDEILASIRKIIASDEGNHQADEQYSSEENSLYAKEIHKEPKSSMLSAREQLATLTKVSSEDNTDNRHLKRSVYEKVSEETKTKVNYDNERLIDEYNSQQNSLHHGHDEEILQALNEIRDSLALNQLQSQKNRHVHHEQIASKEIQEAKLANQRNAQDRTLNIDLNQNFVDINKDNNVINDLDLKPVQFSGDDVPKFLKKFKNQQITERTQNMKQQNLVNYDFSAVPKFDEPNDVVLLTEKVMPKKSEDINKYDDYDDDKISDEVIRKKKMNNTEKTISKLRNGTEEVIRRTAERTLMDNQELHDGDSPLSSLIIKTLKPMLLEWIDKNMQEIAEEVLRDEFRRGLT